jgi:Ca2+-binding RTX toxin-like protein
MKNLAKRLVLVVGLFVVACTGGDAVGESSAALDQGGGGGPAVWQSDPCSDPTLKPTVFDHNGDHVFIGTDKDDVIFGTDGADVIWGGGGNDIICAFDGDDEIHGGAGDDYIDGGGGNDVIFGDEGDDVIHGRAGGDEIHGGPGNDVLFGDILDDKLWGDDGDDLLIGGHGTDEMHGGNGNDYLRGDTGNDSFFGDDGVDVASFMTAMPPGDHDPFHPNANIGVDGVIVDFTDPCVSAKDPSQTKHDGCAYGDGAHEPLDSIEVVVGSPYSDRFITNGTQQFVGSYGNDMFDVPSKSQILDGAGNDTWQGKPFGGAAKVVPTSDVFVFVEAHARDLGVLIMGTASADDVTIHPNAQQQLVVSGNGSTTVRAGGALCHQQGAQEVACDIDHTLRYIAAYGGDGDDHITMQGDFPRDFTAHANGGRDDDTLIGGDEQDVLFSGITGSDWLYGNGGDDALLSESEPEFNAAKLTQNIPYVDGADHLFGGPGNDQLVSDFPCGGHVYSGGDGFDIAGFARSGDLPIHAQLAQVGDNPSIKMPFYAHAYNPPNVPGYSGAFCTIAQGTTFYPDLEVLEASSANDVLYGNDEDNVIWGREGDDEIHGLGGNDHLCGLDGNDVIYGDSGEDVLEGGGGYDLLYAHDGERDVLTCGPQGGRVMSSDTIDVITGCKY